MSELTPLPIVSGRNEEHLKSMKEANILVDYAVADLTVDNECARVVAAACGSLGGLTTGIIAQIECSNEGKVNSSSCEQRRRFARWGHGCGDT